MNFKKAQEKHDKSLQLGYDADEIKTREVVFSHNNMAEFLVDNLKKCECGKLFYPLDCELKCERCER